MSDRVDSWKEIAKYLNRAIRTVQRWERTRRLPIHHLPGGTKPRVYALKAELDSWLRIPRNRTGTHEPLINLQKQLRKLGIGAARDLNQLDQDRLRRLGSPKLICGDVILDGEFVGFDGVGPESLLVEWRPLNLPKLPDYVFSARREIEAAPEEQRPYNNPKVFLDSWRPPIVDEGNRVELTVCRSDWWMRMAFHANKARLQKDILDGRIGVTFSRPLDVDAVVITADDKLVLAYRGKAVTYQQETWSIPGEQIDADKDFDTRARAVSPEKTVMRILTETDELHLPPDVASAAQITFVALVTEWDDLLANLIAVVVLRRTTSAKVADCFPKGEHQFVHFVPFQRNSCLDSCLPLLRDDATIEIPGSSERGALERARLNDMTRCSILAALFNRFGYHEMMEEISRRSDHC